jgi:UDP-N-acetylmuramoyl-tripeptide--D-alanyl-D-alanine ligase
MVAAERVADSSVGLPVLSVADPERALRRLAAFQQRRSRAQLVLVTGTSGKSTVCEMLTFSLGHLNRNANVVVNRGMSSGPDLLLANAGSKAAYLVVEASIRWVHETARLGPASVCAVTNIGLDHQRQMESEGIYGHEILPSIANKKATVFGALAPGGGAVLNADSLLHDHLVERAQASGVGTIRSVGRELDLRVLSYHPGPTSSVVNASVLGRPIKYTLSVPGLHNVHNSLIAIGVMQLLDYDPSSAAEALTKYRARGRRGVWRSVQTSGGAVLLIDDTIGSTLPSLRAALVALEATETQGRRIAVLGRISSLGSTAEPDIRELARFCASLNLDLFVTADPQLWAFRDEFKDRRRIGPHWEEPGEELLHYMASEVTAGDAVLFKGARTHAPTGLSLAHDRLRTALRRGWHPSRRLTLIL